MQINWNDRDPIYRQLRDRLVALILEGVYLEGAALPSVRILASELRINPLTVSRAFQMLVDEDLVDKRRGLGMYVAEGVRDKLLMAEKERFLKEDWPPVRERIQRLNLKLEELLSIRESGSGGLSGADS